MGARAEFLQSFAPAIHPAWAFTAVYAAYWHPLTWLSLALDCEWFGMNAGGHHAVNVLLHVANTVLLFLVLRRMTGATWRSACVAALFGVHPLHVESVAWVAERKDVLSGLFWMLAMWGYVRYVERPTRGRYAVVVGWYAMGLMAKPMVVTLPFVLLLLDYWPLGRTRWSPSVVGNNAPLRFGELVWEKVPLFALAAVSCGVTIWAQHSGGAISSLERLPLGPRMANAVVSYVRYMEKAVWPSGLAVFYPYRAWSPGAVIVAGAILVAVSGVVIRRARRDPHLAVGWFWFLGTLVPVIGLVQVGGQSMADRYTYLPLIGLTIMLCWSVPSRVMERRNLKAITGEQDPDLIVELKSLMADRLQEQGVQMNAYEISDEMLYDRIAASLDLRTGITAFPRARGYVSEDDIQAAEPEQASEYARNGISAAQRTPLAGRWTERLRICGRRRLGAGTVLHPWRSAAIVCRPAHELRARAPGHAARRQPAA